MYNPFPFGIEHWRWETASLFRTEIPLLRGSSSPLLLSFSSSFQAEEEEEATEEATEQQLLLFNQQRSLRCSLPAGEKTL